MNIHGTMEYTGTEKSHFGNTKEHPRIPSAALKIEALHRCFELGEYVARDIGYSRVSIYKWRKSYMEKGAVSLMLSKKRISREKFLENKDAEIPASTAAEMQKKIDDLQLDVDILKETIKILKKDRGADMTSMKNHEKAVVVDALKHKYSLPLLLKKLRLAKRSYYYQESTLRASDKYADFRTKITKVFHENKGCYGYRRIYGALKKAGDTVSEKVVRRLMKEEKLAIIFVKKKKYNSYQSKISLAAENIIARDFHADDLNTKWLTDITEFSHPEGKVYLSALIDCFDGMVISWTIGRRPNAALVNTMLDHAVLNLSNQEHSIVHSDRGCHYRWPGWINRMNEAGLIRSMSKKGCSPDNSACEGFFGRMKNKMYYGRSWKDTPIEAFMQQMDEYLHWYNEKRIKISLGVMSPVEYRVSLSLAA